MAEIFLARATGIADFEKPVVLKRILPQLAGDAEFVSMFLNEARLAATLHHPNIVQVYDIGQRGGAYFFSMEYVHGESLSKVLGDLARRGQHLPLECALHVAASTAAGLHYAHERCADDGTPLGIVHRDVSPSNILVTHHGDVKLVDFGIAKAANDPSFTQAGTLKGKIPYMSPEQCQGEALDRRSDVFSLGVVLYELTTTTRLFAGGNELSLLRRVVEEPIPPPSSRRPDYPAELERIVMKALARDRSERYQSADELAADLEKLAASEALVLSSRPLARTMRQLFGPVRAPTLESVAEDEAWLGAVPDLLQTQVFQPPATGDFGSAPCTPSKPFALPPPPASERLSVGVLASAPAEVAVPAADDSLEAVSLAPERRGWLWIAGAMAAGAALAFVLLGSERRAASRPPAPARAPVADRAAAPEPDRAAAPEPAAAGAVADGEATAELGARAEPEATAEPAATAEPEAAAAREPRGDAANDDRDARETSARRPARRARRRRPDRERAPQRRHTDAARAEPSTGVNTLVLPE